MRWQWHWCFLCWPVPQRPRDCRFLWISSLPRTKRRRSSRQVISSEVRLVVESTCLSSLRCFRPKDTRSREAPILFSRMTSGYMQSSRELANTWWWNIAASVRRSRRAAGPQDLPTLNRDHSRLKTSRRCPFPQMKRVEPRTRRRPAAHPQCVAEHLQKRLLSLSSSAGTPLAPRVRSKQFQKLTGPLDAGFGLRALRQGKGTFHAR